MKVAITGHTNGIGLAIAEIFTENGHNVSGYSRSNGWDLTEDGARKKFIEELVAKDFDCFINNAYPYPKEYGGARGLHGFMQVELLNLAWLQWKNKEGKIIATTSSNASHPIVRSFYSPYSIHKNAIDNTSDQLKVLAEWPHIITLRPGYVDTDAIKDKKVTKMSTRDTAEIIYYVITHKVRIHEICFGPTR